MSHLDIELQVLKKDVGELFKLVQTQLDKCKMALANFDLDLAREVISNEKRVNAYELKIDRDCENIFALFNPVAVDLRFVLAVLKINSNLERIGDIAEGIARFVADVENHYEKDLLQKTNVMSMFETANKMVADMAISFEKEDTSMARTIFAQDEILDAINNSASYAIADYINANPKQTRQALHILSMIRKLERVGDQSKNIAEEIIFYIEAKVLKHLSRQEKQEE